MCGIAGIWDFNKNISTNYLAKEAKKMANSIKSRGPDSSGFWIDANNGLALSHRRLAIQDLTSKGDQPYKSSSERYVIVFNGEIYNHKLLRKEIEKISHNNYKWQSNSDTETLLACIETWGLNLSLNKFVGMFAFALWDRKNNTLHLARDRFGEKPLYYGFKDIFNQKESFIFASDLKALRILSGYQIVVNKNAFASFVNQGYISAPLSIDQGIYQLMPGNYLEVNLKDSKHSCFRKLKPIKWWDPLEIAQHSTQFNNRDENLAIDKLNKILIASLEEKQISDAPFGMFLSGGIDSSLICALLMKNAKKPINTFTISFPDNNEGEIGFDEGPYARKIASYLGTNHSEVRLTSNDLVNLIPSLSSIYSEPFADSSQIPTHLICKEAFKGGIKVALSGDGADELFGGYNRHVFIPKIHNNFKLIPFQMRSLISKYLMKLPINSKGLYQQKIQKLSRSLINAEQVEDIYYSLINEFSEISNVINKEYFVDGIFKNRKLPKAKSISEQIMLADIENYLHSDILVKTDRASMATSLEVRSPFLDHRIAELAWQIPISMKIRNRKNKWILRKILSGYLPKSITNRPKSGFAMPINNWLRGPLKNWANDLLSESLIKKQNYFNSKYVTKIWEAHLTSGEDNSAKLWIILMWQSWLHDIGI